MGTSLEKVFTAPKEDQVTESALPSEDLKIQNKKALIKNIPPEMSGPTKINISPLKTKRKFPIADKIRSGLRSLTPKIFKKKG